MDSQLNSIEDFLQEQDLEKAIEKLLGKEEQYKIISVGAGIAIGCFDGGASLKRSIAMKLLPFLAEEIEAILQNKALRSRLRKQIEGRLIFYGTKEEASTKRVSRFSWSFWKRKRSMGLEDLALLDKWIAEKFNEIAEWEQNYTFPFYDNLILAQCVRLERLLVEILLTDGAEIAEQIKEHLRPKQKEIIDYFFSKDQKATLGFIELWLIGLKRSLGNTTETGNSSKNWLAKHFGPVKNGGIVYDPLTLFTDKELIAFTKRMREKYRNPLVHPSTDEDVALEKNQYQQWCKDAYGRENVNEWLQSGWSGVFGWISILATSAAQSRK